MVVAVVAVTALLLQYALLILSTLDDIGPLWATLRYLSFFTILSNLLVCLTASFALTAGGGRIGEFFRRASVRGAVALCIGVTGLIYYFVLSATWAPTGLQWLVDKLLHYAVPLLYLLWWASAVEHARLRWSDPLRWVLFPVGFFGWTLLRGAFLHEYPYPFVDVDAIGYFQVSINAAVVGALFAGLGFVIVALDRAWPRRD